MVQNISVVGLVGILSKTTENVIKIEYVTECKMTKNGNPFFVKEGRSFVPTCAVEKKVTGVYSFGGSYEERVNEALVADGSTGTFNSGALAWGQYVKGAEGRVIEHNGKFYVRCYMDNPSNINTRYTIDGHLATDTEIDTIKEFTPKSSGSAKQLAEGLTEDKQIKPLNIEFGKIEKITIGSTEYAIL